MAVVRGADLDIPCAYPEPNAPQGFTKGTATHTQMQEAGFRSELAGTDRLPGEQPLDEMLVEGSQIIDSDVAGQILRQIAVLVLHDPDDNIVAMWNEGPLVDTRGVRGVSASHRR